MPPALQHAGVLLAAAAISLAAAAGGWLSAAALRRALGGARAALAQEQQNRAAERAGRIRAERQVKELRLQLAAAPGANTGNAGSGAPPVSFPFVPIGVLRSVFADRRGTPRQPHLVPAARAVLQLAPGVPAASLQGLDQYSHVWLLYVFHENTDLAKQLAARASGGASCVKALVSVPRLDGARLGVLATRSPHRPVPVGLSTARLLRVDAATGVVELGGADVVDGSPVLDVKPYVPFSDALRDATAPGWVAAAAAGDEPLALGGVRLSPDAAAALAGAWRQAPAPLCSSEAAFQELVQQVLARDIRSLHQRTRVAPVAKPRPQDGLGTPPRQQQAQQEAQQEQARVQQQPSYSVTLDGVTVSYTVCPDSGCVVVHAAQPAA